jgi:AraC-like DNA-binding protein
MYLPHNFFKERRLSEIVENQTTYAAKNAALHVFETHGAAKEIQLRFANPVLASMLEGKKIMHLNGQNAFEFLPGESLIMPSDELMCIDFPEARMDNPTRCLAMELSQANIRKTVQHMNEQMTKPDGREWQSLDFNFHFPNDDGIHQIIQRLIYLFAENHPSKDFFVNNMIQELIVRILQVNTRERYSKNAMELATNNRVVYVIRYIRQNLHKPFTIEELSEKACMSASNFYKVFKHEMGISPVDFINKERIELAIKLLKAPQCNITDVFVRCGFSNRSYFNRVFKRLMGQSPTEFLQDAF